MAAPVEVAIPADTWTEVATDVTTGQVHRKITTVSYLQTYRPTGGAIPTDQDEGVPAFVGGLPEEINSSDPIDVYIFAIGKAGNVRVDL